MNPGGVDCSAGAQPGTFGNKVDVNFERLNATTVRVEFVLVGYNPCATIAPAIDATFAIQFRHLCGRSMQFMFEPGGKHDGFPWHELYIGNTLIHKHDPCITGHGPGSLAGSGDVSIITGPNGHPLVNVWRDVDNPWDE